MSEAHGRLAPTDDDLARAAQLLVPRLEVLALRVEHAELQRAGRRDGCEWPAERCSCARHRPRTAPTRRLAGWRPRAVCADHPDLDFVVAPGAAERAVCAACPVAGACHDYAEADVEAVGLHAGVDWRPEVRMRLGKKR